MVSEDTRAHLVAIRDLLASSRTIGATARNDRDLYEPWFSPRAVVFDLYGAIYCCVPDNVDRQDVVRALRAALPNQALALQPCTDGLGDSDLLAFIDKATEAA